MTRWQAVFLDRDGTVNAKAAEGSYVADPEDLVLLPGAAAAIARLNRARIRVILVTNQRWMAGAGPLATERYAATHARLVHLLERAGARLDAAYHCPHQVGACRCRKPAPGMLLDAAREMDLDLLATALVGDAESDVAAGRAVGAATVLLDPTGLRPTAADATLPDLVAAADWLLGPLPTG